ncbi:MAG: GAF domain-containing protein [Candidatus Aureabacteria bacterium]|nr:GAF domain-containing protein [Candidatus Auribacterota bacterium]
MPSGKKSYEDQLEALFKISKAIASDNYLEDILKLIVAVTAQVMNSMICSLLLIDEKKQEFVVRASQSVSEEYNKKPPLKITEGIAGKAVKEKKPIVVKDLMEAKDYKYREIAEKEGLKSLLCVPLIVKDKVIGVINCYTPVKHEFTYGEMNILKSIAHQAAVAIENTELMVKTRVIQEELEARKKTEKAKGILMQEEGLKEQEAYSRIQKFAMDNRKTMREISEAIILSYEMRKNRSTK